MSLVKRELYNGLFNKIFPDIAVRNAWLQFVSIAFEGSNYRKCIINHGYNLVYNLVYGYILYMHHIHTY